MISGLNPQQQAAVTLPTGHALVLAGAGSGKTRVLTTRMAWLIQTNQASPQALLAVTFTNKSAREMLTRLSSLLPINTRGMWVGTFHGICNRLLRAHHRDAGLPQTFQILDTADQLSAIKRLVKAANIEVLQYCSPQNGLSLTNEVVLVFTGDSGAVKQSVIAAREVGNALLATLGDDPQNDGESYIY